MDRTVVLDVEATTAVRQAEIGAAWTMLTRTDGTFGLWPARLTNDAGHGSAALLGWLVHERAAEPHTRVFDESAGQSGTSQRGDARYDRKATSTSARRARCIDPRALCARGQGCAMARLAAQTILT